MVDDVHNAQNAEEVAFANMVGNAHNAQNAEEEAFANMVGNVHIAKNAEEVAFANIVGNVENANFVHSAHIARKVWTVLIALRNLILYTATYIVEILFVSKLHYFISHLLGV